MDDWAHIGRGNPTHASSTLAGALPKTKEKWPMWLNEPKDDEALALDYPELTSSGISDDYGVLCDVLMEALGQAAEGKGKERHATPEPFDKQIGCMIEREFPGFALGQAVKKIKESKRLPAERAIHEVLGAINYIAMAIIIQREKLNEREKNL